MLIHIILESVDAEKSVFRQGKSAFRPEKAHFQLTILSTSVRNKVFGINEENWRKIIFSWLKLIFAGKMGERRYPDLGTLIKPNSI